MKKVVCLVFSLIAVAFISACNKDEEVLGCTDPSAPNYSYEATVDDGSCNQLANVRFWIQENTWNAFTNFQNDTLSVSVCGQQIGVLSSAASYLATPFCSSSGLLDYAHEFNATNKEIMYEVRDENGVLVSSSTTELSTSGDCQLEQIQ